MNRYTETLSSIARAHGGTVVEFLGDGMTIVFGAPVTHETKERAALAAGREMVAAVATLASGVLAVGVGIATGRAVVGNGRAVDRLIWTAIGSTVNLAARLQVLTRTLAATVVVDVATWEGAGSPRELQRRARVEIRGLSAARDVYALPVG